MLWFLVIALMFVWVVGAATGHTVHGYIHLLYAVAMLVAIARVVIKRNVL